LRNKASHLDESLWKIAQLEDSAPRGSSSLQIPGGLPAQADTTEMDVDPEPMDGRFHSFHSTIHCHYMHHAAINNIDDQDSSESGNPEHPGTVDRFESDEIDNSLVSFPSI
jgi:hypothetical protein